MTMRRKPVPPGAQIPVQLDATPPQPSLLGPMESATVADVLRGFPRGGRLHCFTLGQWDMSDWIDGLCEIASPVEDVLISTWSAMPKHIARMQALDLPIRWLLDSAYPRREPDAAKLIVDTWGEDAVAILSSHAKFVLVRGAGWHLASMTTTNLNMAARCEGYSLDDSEALHAWYDSLWHDARRWGGTVGAPAHRSRYAALDELARPHALAQGLKTMQDLLPA